MSVVKRFDLVFSEHFGGGIGAKENGKFCLHKDYAALKSKHDALAVENAVMLKLLTVISEQYQEVRTESEENAAIIDLDYISEVNTYVSRDVDGENPFLATDAHLNSVRAQGIHFAANRMLAAWDSGFIDDTPAQAYDISGAVLSAIEFLPNASPEEFRRDFADSIRREIKASTASAVKDGE